MAKTFKSLNGESYEISEEETWVEVNEDIETDEISNYFVVVNDKKIEVSEKTYNAVKKYLDK